MKNKHNFRVHIYATDLPRLCERTERLLLPKLLVGLPPLHRPVGVEVVAVEMLRRGYLPSRPSSIRSSRISAAKVHAASARVGGRIRYLVKPIQGPDCT